MKTKKFINGFVLALSTVLASMFVACNPEKPENEKENKLKKNSRRLIKLLHGKNYKIKWRISKT